MDLPTITTTSATTHHHHRHQTNTNTNQPVLDPTLVPTGPLTSITDIGFVEDQNARFRKTMEDGHAMIDGFRGVSHDGFFAIYDGHGGKAAVTHVQKMFHKIFEDEMNMLDGHSSTHQSTIVGDVNERIRLTHAAFMNTYRRMDEELKEALYNGTTAITCYLTRDFTTTTATTNNNDHNNNNNNNNDNNNNENDDKKTNNNYDQLLFTSNCGDARVVLSQNGQAHRLTFDHKASEASEVQRIRDSHGFVAFNRVNGILAVTRALGDYAMKQWVISEPYQSCFRIPAKTNRNTSNNNNNNDADDFLILACDGLWDVFEDQECVDFVSHLFQQHRMSAQDAAQKLLHKSLEKGSTDNISIMVIKL